MQPFPHRYVVTAEALADGDVALESDGLEPIRSAPPVEFDGPGGQWSPETLLVAAAADCFLLTFRAIANVSKLPWTSLTCNAHGIVDRVDRVTQFTALTLHARLCLPPGASEEQAWRVLRKAKEQCLVTNSFRFLTTLEAEVEVAEQIGVGSDQV
ncbi:MAG TPA: OsmC family protein [Vicinamibacterales bacterium]